MAHTNFASMGVSFKPCKIYLSEFFLNRIIKGHPLCHVFCSLIEVRAGKDCAVFRAVDRSGKI